MIDDIRVRKQQLQRDEFERRVRDGLKPSPLVEHKDLGEIAGEENLQRVSRIEELNQVTESIVRGKSLLFHTPSKRLLWQAFGHEYIEPDLLNFIDQIPSDETYFDIGASNGIFALYAAATGKKVICFEPEVANFALLNYNSYLNAFKNRHAITNFNVALSDKTGLGNIFIEKFEPGGHLKILDAPIKRGEKIFTPDYKQAVLKYSLDDFIALFDIEVPNYIKIDVDGYEQEVLMGMNKVLNSNKIKKIFIELEEGGNNFIKCKNILADHGFSIESKQRVQNYFGEENYIFSK